MGMAKFYWRWISQAIKPSWAIFGLTAGLVRLLILPIRWYRPAWETVMTSLLLEVPFWTFMGVCVVRIFLAPYWMDQEREKVEVDLRNLITEERTQEQKKRENLTRLARLLVDEIGRNLLLQGRQKAHLARGAFDTFSEVFWQMIPNETESTQELIKCLENIDRAMKQVEGSTLSTTAAGMFDSAYVPAAQATIAALRSFISQQEIDGMPPK
jgi:hypothetical protein